VTALFDAPPADSYDVVVAGSGAPALMAAAVAAERGLTVLVLERSGLLGGTSSISAGTVWVPCNPYQPGVGATSGVVLACGGFEWNAEMLATHLGGRLRGRCSPPFNTGDGHQIAAAAGAALADLDQAWWAPMADLPGDARDGRPVGRLIRTERQGPGSIVVDATGRRFADESQDYNSFIRAYFAACERNPDRGNGTHRSGPMYVVFDQRFLDRFGFITHRRGQPVPDWLTCRDSIRELAEALSAEPHQLAATIERFNAGAVEGEDPDFARGADRYDRYGGDLTNPWPNPCLAPIDHAPFYGMPLQVGAFGTSGGVVADDCARALDADGEVIAGLFAVGNVSAHPVCAGYPGAGGTLGPALTMAYLAGQSIGAGAAGRRAATSMARRQ
jgi:3-oxosteroid 1-dehydrogenase